MTKLLPSNIEAEAIVLGSIILDPATGSPVRETLCRADFFQPRHGIVYETLCQMSDNGVPVELPTLSDELRKIGLLAQAGGDEYLNMLVEGVPSTASVMHYAGIVKERADARQIIQLALNLSDTLYEGTGNPYVCAGQAIASLTEIQPHGADYRLSTLAQAVEMAATEAIDAYHGKRPAMLQTGFHEIDRATGGLAPGELIVVAADTSLGKTSLCIAFMINLADKAGTTLYVSAEMPVAQVGKRILQVKGGVNAARLRTGKDLIDRDFTQIEIVRDEVSKWTGYVWSKNPTVQEITAKMEQLERRDGKKIDLLAIDYLQLLRASRGQTRAQQVSAMANDLKSLAVEKQIPIILVSQFNRQGVSLAAPPSIHSLKESGDVENAADIIILLHRPPEPELSLDGTMGKVWLRIAKARDGRTTAWEGEYALRLWWKPSTTQFLNIAKEQYYG